MNYKIINSRLTSEEPLTEHDFRAIANLFPQKVVKARPRGYVAAHKTSEGYVLTLMGTTKRGDGDVLTVFPVMDSENRAITNVLSASDFESLYERVSSSLDTSTDTKLYRLKGEVIAVYFHNGVSIITEDAPPEICTQGYLVMDNGKIFAVSVGNFIDSYNVEAG